METKLNKIKEVIKSSGISTVPVEDILKRIIAEYGNDDAKFQHCLEQYKKYLFHYELSTFGTDPKYIAKSDKPDDLDTFIFLKKQETNFEMPQTPLTKYLFGDENFYDLVDRFNDIDNRLKKQRLKNLKKYNTGL